MNNLTSYVTSKTSKIQVFPEIVPGDHGFSMFNSGGVEVEVAELLYSLVRVFKPNFIFETGTHYGVSALYMALALEENKKGKLVTCEVMPDLQKDAVRLWEDLSVRHRIQNVLHPSLNIEIEPEIDFLFLDSEPHLRFDEFVKFFSKVKPGALIVIHDLHRNLNHTRVSVNGMYDWPFGNWRDKMGDFVKQNLVQVLHLPTPRGCTIFQKVHEEDDNIRYLQGKE